MEERIDTISSSRIPEVTFCLALTDQLPVLSVSDGIDALLGFTREDFLLGRIHLKELIHPHDLDIAETLFTPNLFSTSGHFNIRLRQANGRIRCIRGFYEKGADAKGDGVNLDLLLQDAKSLKRTLDAAVSMANFRAIMENTDDYIYFKDRNHVFTGASQTLVSLCSSAEHWTDLIGQTDYDVLPEEYADIYYQLEKRVFAGVVVAREIQEFLTTDGKKGWVDNRKYPIHDENGEIIGLFGIARDITERKQTEQALLESEERFRALSEASFGGIIIHDKGLILECNTGLSDMTGFSYQELIGSDGLKLIAPETLDPVVDNIRDGFEEGYEVQGIRKDGTLYPLAIRGKNITYKDRLVRVIEFRDITDLKHAVEERINLEKQLLHAQKMESLGVLAGGIAHDFNNILTSIIGNADLALLKLNPESPVLNHLKWIEQAAFRAADLAKQMLAYSGKGKFVVEPIDLNRLIEEMEHLIHSSISKKAELHFNFTRSIPLIKADATQIRQVVMNLIINASEAIGDQVGTITVTTDWKNCDRDYVRGTSLSGEIAEGLYVSLEVADTGCGMDREAQSKIFDPFFTTKFTGRGLGMSAVLGIIRGHRGAIRIDSEPGKGSIFRILLPAIEERAAQRPHEQPEADFHGTGTVLLVDDEDAVRDVGKEMLELLGFTVVTARDGHEALAAFKANPSAVCVILDLTMPRMDGEQCFRELRLLDPNVKVIMSSGYCEHEISNKFTGQSLAGFIKKPYTVSSLREVLKRWSFRP